MGFEHNAVSLRDRTLPIILDIINDFDAAGWELVTVDNGIAYFKRPAKEVIKKSSNSDSYTYETTQDGYVIFDNLGKKVDPWRLISILDNCLTLSGSL